MASRCSPGRRAASRSLPPGRCSWSRWSRDPGRGYPRLVVAGGRTAARGEVRQRETAWSTGVDGSVGPRYGRCGMVTEGPAEVLHGRRVEREVLERLLEAVRGGQSRVLVVRGEPGVGKTALLESAIESASGFRVARAVGVESEMELAFAALQQLCAPMLDRLDRLPGPQREALGVAFGLRAGDAPDRFLVGSGGAEPAVGGGRGAAACCVWSMTRSGLIGLRRRRSCSWRAGCWRSRSRWCWRRVSRARSSQGLPELVVEGLRDGDARALLGSVLGVPLDERVRERIVAETRGNPLALLELPRGLTPAELAGGFGLPDAPALSGRIEESFRRRLSALPARDPAAVAGRGGRAGRRPGAGVAGGRAARDRSSRRRRRRDRRAARDRRARDVSSSAGALGVYRAASPEEQAGGASARWPTRPTPTSIPIAAPGTAPRRRRGPTRTSPLSSSARPAALRRAAGWRRRPRSWSERPSLTPEPARRAERALAAAQAKHQAGAFDAALGLLAIAEAGPLDELQRAQVDLLRAQIAFASAAAATRHRCCSRRPSASSRSMRGSRARPISTRSPPRSSPARLASDESVLEAAGPPGRRLRRRSLRARPICCWMAWRC